jgi:hypothetical protein
MGAGAYGLTERIVIRDKPIKVLGDGIGISKVIWAAHAKTSGLVIIQVPAVLICAASSPSVAAVAVCPGSWV